MLQVNDKIKYAKKNSMIGVPLGTIFTVTEIKGTVVALEAKTNLGSCIALTQCVMSYDEYERYFEKVIELETKKNVWTEWRKIERSELNKILGNLDKDCYIIEYLQDYFGKECYWGCFETRNNGKKTDVRITFSPNQKVKATTTCNKVDTFDETKGIEVALIKAFAKQIAHLSTVYINGRY